MDEFELKRMLTKEEYEMLLIWYGPRLKRLLQVNYYYDTEKLDFHRQGITIRIRQKNDLLKGTVKRHSVRGNPYRSSEERFFVLRLPRSMKYEKADLSLFGQLVTERLSVSFESGLKLMLDKNYYLGRLDYELEVEFPENGDGEAAAFMENIARSLRRGGFQQKRTLPPCAGKAQRFFTALEELRKMQRRGEGKAWNPF